MAGQALIKALAFGSNNWAVSQILETPTLLQLFFAAGFSGLVASVIVSPIERIKVLMQADAKKEFKSEIECLSKVLKQDGVTGLLSRGLLATIIREVPSYGIYFVSYEIMMDGILGNSFGPVASLVCGGLAGCFSWIPVYPFDVIKTNMQNTKGNVLLDNSIDSNDTEVGYKNIQNDGTFISTAVTLWQKGGASIFFDGLTPKLIRAVINHSVTFFVYGITIDEIMKSLS